MEFIDSIKKIAVKNEKSNLINTNLRLEIQFT